MYALVWVALDRSVKAAGPYLTEFDAADDILNLFDDRDVQDMQKFQVVELVSPRQSKELVK